MPTWLSGLVAFLDRPAHERRAVQFGQRCVGRRIREGVPDLPVLRAPYEQPDRIVKQQASDLIGDDTPIRARVNPRQSSRFSLLTRVRIRMIFLTKETRVPLYGTLRGKPCPARPSRLRRLLASLVPSSYSMAKRGIQAAGGNSVEAADGTGAIGSLQASGVLDAQGGAYGRGG
jgi:hypothetical protein